MVRGADQSVHMDTARRALCVNERGINYLVVTLVGIAVAVAFMVASNAGLLNTYDAAKTQQAKTVIADIASKAQQVDNNTGSYPSPINALTDVLTAMPGSFAAPPCDALDKTCPAQTTTSSDFFIDSWTVSGTWQFIIYDAVKHPSPTLNGLPQNNRFAAPIATCQTPTLNCTHLWFSSSYGFQGT
jgi:hypothetical protein